MTKSESIQEFNQWAEKIMLELDTQKENQHKWIFAVIMLSSAIFEFLGAALLDYEGIRHISFLYVSMFLFAANVCIGLWLTKGRIEKNVDRLADEYKFVDELRAKVLKLPDSTSATGLSATVFEKLKERKENQDRTKPPKEKRDYSMDILIYIFYGAIILLAGSFISYS